MTRKKTEQAVDQEVPKEEVQEHPEYDLYKMYQDYFAQQQRTTLEIWTANLKNLWWWKK